jgi:tripartite-type tricarboxylate transporter receptor subunit TctC
MRIINQLMGTNNMKKKTRHWICAVVLTCVNVLGGISAHSEIAFPTRPVRLIVPFPPGQATDIIARLLAQELTNIWKQQVVVENISGGSSIPATVVGRNAPADGYTILFGTSSTFAVNPSTYTDLPYDTQRDFTMVNAVFVTPWVIVANPDTPYNTLNEMVAAAKAKPNTLLWGLGATALQLGAELFKHRVGVDIVDVPYRGSGQAVNDLLGNQIPMLIDTVAATLPNIKAGTIKPLASLSAQRLPWLPDVPTAEELGYAGVEAEGWGGLAVPKATPAEIVDKIGADVRFVLKNPSLRARINENGAIPDERGPKEWSEFVNREIKKWTEVAQRANIKQ